MRFRHLISDLSGERVVILSTHIVSDVEASVTEIALIRQGRLLMHASPEDLLKSVEGHVWEQVMASADLPAAKEKFLISSTIRRSDGVRVRIVADESPGPGAQAAVPNLEDAYLHHITADRIRAAA